MNNYKKIKEYMLEKYNMYSPNQNNSFTKGPDLEEPEAIKYRRFVWVQSLKIVVILNYVDPEHTDIMPKGTALVVIPEKRPNIIDEKTNKSILYTLYSNNEEYKSIINLI